jgi:hypothetical protein
MSDITMCQNKSCPSCEQCLRFKASPNPFVQSYADMKPEGDDTECEYYLELFGLKLPEKS